MNIFRSLLALALIASATHALAAKPDAATSNAKSLPAVQRTRVVEAYGKLPLSFEPNQGQADPHVKFLSHGDGYTLSLKASEAVLLLQGRTCSQPSRAPAIKRSSEKPLPCVASANSVLRMNLLNSNLDAQVQGEDELPGKSNYFVGKDPSAWHRNIANYQRVQYHDIYPGITLAYYGNQRQFEHDFTVAPGADPKAIRLSFTGARRVAVDRYGNLVLAMDKGTLLFRRPVVYQEIAGARREISGKYIRKSGSVIGFLLGDYDHKEKLVIDPVLVYSTYFNGNGIHVLDLRNVAVDSDKNMYVSAISAGSTSGSVVPSVSKLSADGSKLLYSTFLASDGATYTYGLAVDTTGDAYVTGYTTAFDYPVVNALQPVIGGTENCFLTKLNQEGSDLIYSTFLGGKDSVCEGVAVDAFGSAFLTGYTAAGFPAVHSLSTKGTAFVAKLSPSGLALDYSTVFGGSIGEEGRSIAVDPSGEAIVVGDTASSDFPVKNALFPTCIPNARVVGGGCADVFATKFNATGTDFIYSTFLVAGGASAVATNALGDAFIAGSAYENLPVVNAIYPKTSVDGFNGFVMRLTPSGSALVYSTYIADAAFGSADGVAVDSLDNAYVVGNGPKGLPLVHPLEPVYVPKRRDNAAFLAKIPGAGAVYDYLTYLGPISNASDVAVDSVGDAYVAGSTFSNHFPLVNPLQRTATQGFISKISENTTQFSISENVDRTTVSPGGDLHYSITVTNRGSLPGSGVVSVTSVRDRFRTCTVSNGDICRFVLLGGRATVELTPLMSGESRSVLIYATAAETAGDFNEIPSEATISSGPPPGEIDSASTTVLVREAADIGVTSSLIDNTNGLLHFVHSVTNIGPDNSHAVLLLDPLPANTTFVSATTTAGSCSFHPTMGAHGSVRCPLNNPNTGAVVKIDVRLQGTVQACRSVTNTVSITSQSIDSNSANDSISVVAPLPNSVCGPPPDEYQVTFFDVSDIRSTAGALNNNGDLLGGNNGAIGPFIYKNGATGPTPIPVQYEEGFNDRDEVIGEDRGGYGVYKNGAFQALNFGAQFPYPYLTGINNAGDIIGNEDDGPVDEGYPQPGAFLYKDGVSQVIGGTYTVPTSVNKKGEVSGSDASYNGSSGYAFLYTHDRELNITPNYDNGYSNGIDSSGRVVGSLTPKGTTVPHFFIYSGGLVQDLTPTAVVDTYPYAINDCGEIVGNDASQVNGFLYAHGKFVALNSLVPLPSGASVQPGTINNRGQISGSVYDSNTNKYQSFLMTPKVLEKCGSDATIDNTPNVTTSSLDGNITYTIVAKNLDSATSAFTVKDTLDPTTSLVSCSVSGGAGTCAGTPGSQAVSVALPNLVKGAMATITLKVAGSSVPPAQNVIMNTAKLSSSVTADYLSTAYTAVP